MKSGEVKVDAVPAASVASRAGSEPDERMFDLTLECVGRTVDVTFSRPQIDALIARLREFGLLAPIAPAAAAEPSERCAKCGGRDIPWGHGKCHCFKKTKDNDGREQHGADAEGVAQVGGADAGTNRLGARPGANLGDEHRGAEAADHGHAGYSLGEEVRFPSRRELQEGIDLTPEPEDLRAIFPDRERAASLVASDEMLDSIEVARLWEVFLASDEGQRGIGWIGGPSSNAHGAMFVAFRAGLNVTRTSAGEAQS